MYTQTPIYIYTWIKNICMYLNHAATPIFCFSKGFGSRIAWWTWGHGELLPTLHLLPLIWGSCLWTWSIELVWDLQHSPQAQTQPKILQKTGVRALFLGWGIVSGGLWSLKILPQALSQRKSPSPLNDTHFIPGRRQEILLSWTTSLLF